MNVFPNIDFPFFHTLLSWLSSTFPGPVCRLEHVCWLSQCVPWPSWSDWSSQYVSNELVHSSQLQKFLSQHGPTKGFYAGRYGMSAWSNIYMQISAFILLLPGCHHSDGPSADDAKWHHQNCPMNAFPVSPCDFMFTALGSSVTSQCEHETDQE